MLTYAYELAGDARQSAARTGSSTPRRQTFYSSARSSSELGRACFARLYVAAGVLGGIAAHRGRPVIEHRALRRVGAICGLLPVVAVMRPRLIGFVAGFVMVNIWWALSGTAVSISFATHLGGFSAGQRS